MVTVPGRKVRVLLADLLEREGRPAFADRLIEDLWDEELPGNPAGALAVKISLLRRVLDDAEPGARRMVRRSPAGYSLRVDDDQIDALRFRALVRRARETADLAARAAFLREGLALWRGPAFADLGDEAFLRPALARLEELRITAFEDLAEVRLHLGEHVALAGELGELLDAHPLRERLRGAHMRALYGAGRQNEALASYEELRVSLVDELGLNPGPELATLRRAILEQDPALGRAPEEAARSRTNVYLPATSLVGRDEAIADVTSTLDRHRLVTLTGPGGVGKSRLAVEVAARLCETFPDGVWLIDLAALQGPSTPDAIAEVAMRMLDIRDPAGSEGPRTPIDRLGGALRGRRLLLLLDNCEHVIEPAAELASFLLRGAPGLRALSTSREPLRLAEEVVWSVPPLDVPDVAAGHVPAALAEYDAVRLFVDRASAASRDFRIGPETAPAITTVCRQLDGIPLALEMAATRVRALGVQGVAAQLGDRFRLLTHGHRDAPARHRSLTAMLDWSWELLAEPERAVLRRLSVHCGGCSLDAVRGVCAGDGVPHDEVLDLLSGLVDRSLVVVTQPMEDGPRYRLLESVAAYCRGRLDDAHERDRMRRRHNRYYGDLAERAEQHLHQHDQRGWMARLDAEAANLDAALEGLVSDRLAEPALRMVDALAWYWYLRGRLTHARSWLAAALALGGGHSRHRARAVAWEAGFAFVQGDDAGWSARRDAALGQFDEVDDPAGRLRAMWFLAFTASELDDHGAGGELLDQALEGFRANGDAWGRAAALLCRAKQAHMRGEPAMLERDVELAARLFAGVGDRWGQLQAAQWLGGLAELTGQYDRADALQREGLRMAEELGLWPNVAELLAWRGWIAVMRGEPEVAQRWCEDALRLAVEQGHGLVIHFAEIGLGFAARHQGRLEAAEAVFSRLLNALPEQGAGSTPPYLSLIHLGLGQVAERRADAAGAVASHRVALAAALAAGAHRCEAMALEGLAAGLCLAGRHVHAARLSGAAAAIRRRLGLSPGPVELDDLRRTGLALRAALAPEVHHLEIDRGATLSPEECLREVATLCRQAG